MEKSIFLSAGVSVYIYDEEKDLFEEHMPEFLDGLSEDEMIALEHMNDFEYFKFLVVGGCNVAVLNDCNDIVTTFDSLEAFASATMEEIKE